ncbi:kinase-like domain-containing protein [Trametes punicea]|nr:kinase-like domain-containing protein [Trametes punicea]
MSVFRAIFSCLFSGPTAVKATSNETRSPFGLPGNTVNALIVANSARHLASPQPSCLLYSTDSSSQAAHFGYVERHYGLGILVAKALGLPNPLRLLSRAFKLASGPSSSSSGLIFGPRTPSPASSVIPETPEDSSTIPHYPPGFARANPPKVHWLPTPSALAPCQETLSDYPTLPGPVRAVNGSPKSPSGQDSMDAATMYVQALQACFPMPPRLDQVVLPSYESLQSEENPADVHESAAYLSSADTEPAWSPGPAAAAQKGGSGKQKEDVDRADEECGSEEEGDDVDETHVDLASLVPRHPDGTEYTLLGMLGQGGFGRVMLAATSTGEFVALKVMHKPMLYHTAGMRDSLYTERDLMAMATRHDMPFLMHMKAAWEEEDNVYFAMDLCAEDLRSRIKRAVRSGQKIPKHELKLLCAEMLLALVDLDVLEVVHGDIKPDNILLTRSGRIVLSDLGLAQCAQALDPDRDPRAVPFHEWSAPSAFGTAGYYAPEALRRDRSDADASFTSKVDVFSLGLVFVELLCGLEVPLWDTLDEPEGIDIDLDAWRSMGQIERQAARMMTEGLRNVLEGDRIADEDARDLVRQMLHPEPRERPTPYQLLRHRYFSDLDIQAVRDGLVPHDYRPRCFARLRREVKDVSFRTWQRRSGRFLKRTSEYAEQQELGPLDGFTWPEAR